MRQIINCAGWIILCSLFAFGPAAAGPGDRVDVRVVDIYSGEVLAESSLTIEHRLEIAQAPEHMRYLGLRREQFRGREVLEISLAGEQEAWEQAGYAAWNEPASNAFGRIAIETVPSGWADRYCRALRSIESPAVRDPSVSLSIGGNRHLSESGWNGEGRVDLQPVAAPGGNPEWQARIDTGGRLHVREANLGSWRAVAHVRDDFYTVRRLLHSAGPITVTFEPSSYARRFCERYANQGDRYVRTIVDYIFGRAVAGDDNSQE